MDEEIVPYEEALELEKLGCNMHCWGSCYYEFYDRGNTYILLKTPDDMNSKDGVNAPTFSQAFRWFREKYKIGSWIHHYFNMDKGNFEYSFVLTLPHKDDGYVYERHEEAELACLRKLIEIVKETNK